ncbi:hypothetical protein [Acinetobacter calcoaceticus]|uniref:hypothetical protein n=1 Tax=Acinetobacter calcoaceticus TaxID=471 RepID=UPI001E62DEA3|nr:hypothetical protein [Acinetobacter calcoaceticus]UGQ27241.1 hypothetical protein LRO55_05010 [Acinetobacter calcoaceticus]
MREFFLSTRISKVLGNADNEIKKQLEKVEQIITELSVIDPIFKNWYINNPVGSKPPYDYPFPSDKAHNYLFNLRKNDINESFLLWNGSLESEQFASFMFDRSGLVMDFKKVLDTDQMIQLFKAILKYPKCDYVYINTDFFNEINVYPHRAETTSICYVPVEIAADYLPHLYQKIEIENEYNKGTILVFAENWSDETEELKKIVQENSIALIELGVIPEAGLPDGFFNE